MLGKLKFFLAAILVAAVTFGVFQNVADARSNYMRPREGYYFIVPAVNPNFAMDVQAAGIAERTPIWLYERNNSDAQYFYIQRVSGDWYRIIHGRTGLVVNVKEGNSENDARLWLYRDDGSPSCYWRFIDVGYGECVIQSQVYPNRMIDLHQANAYNGALIHLWGPHFDLSARWILVRV